MAAGLATRCPACGTVFRVVPDQLRVSEGWVRCGRCANVFNASETLVDLETGTPRRPSDDTAASMPMPPAGAIDAATVSGGAALPTAVAPPVAASVGFNAHVDPPFGDDLSTMAAAGAGASAHDEAQAELPSFVRRANRAARWKQPRVRAALVATAVLGALLLAGQVVHEYRDLLAARVPAARPALVQACQWLGCSVGAARAIEAFAVESSGLVRVEQSNVYRLTVALRNHSAIELALPALDLSLTDSQGKLLARRMLRAAELGANQSTLGAGRDLALQTSVQTGTDVVAGYTIELFYP